MERAAIALEYFTFFFAAEKNVFNQLTMTAIGEGFGFIASSTFTGVACDECDFIELGL